jgi:uncharacterized protein YeaO (DUF488 family)
MTNISVKRVYDSSSKDDGYRILVDRLWPRGLSKESAGINEWIKEIGPSNELRKWFGHDVEKWEEFRRLYRKELKESAAIGEIINLIKKYKHVTLLFGAKDEEHNQAIVLKEYLQSLVERKK